MQTIIGVSLFILGWIAIIVANFLRMLGEVELLEKRPDLAGVVYGKWISRSDPWKVARLYKSEFPNGKRIKNFWRLVIVAIAAWIAGILMLLDR